MSVINTNQFKLALERLWPGSLVCSKISRGRPGNATLRSTGVPGPKGISLADSIAESGKTQQNRHFVAWPRTAPSWPLSRPRLPGRPSFPRKSSC